MKVRHRQTFYAVSLLVCDLSMVLGAFHFTYWLRFKSHLFPLSSGGVPDYGTYVPAFALAALLMIFVFRASGLYIEERISDFKDEPLMVLKAVALSFLILLAASFFFRENQFSRLFLPLAWVSVTINVLLGRYALAFAYLEYRRRRNKFKEVLMIGASRMAARYAVRQHRQYRLCTRVVGFLDSKFPSLKRYKYLPVLGRPDDLERVLKESPHLNEVIVTSPDIPHRRIIEMMAFCEKRLVSFKWFPDILGLAATQMRVRYEFGMPLLCPKEPPLTEWENRLLKRTMDVTLSAAALLALAPVLACFALAVVLDSRGPVFYRQERVGEDGRTFMLYKFRTMKPNAEKETGPVWARENDARRTRIGGFLRKFNIDELPQLWNVLAGDMSLVGPRPERPHFVGQFREDIPRYMGRHLIKSGITGWAQVNGLRGNTSIEERTKYDLFYIENWSIFLDIKILFMTLFAYKNAY